MTPARGVAGAPARAMTRAWGFGARAKGVGDGDDERSMGRARA